jgi:hypothetical protein
LDRILRRLVAWQIEKQHLFTLALALFVLINPCECGGS